MQLEQLTESLRLNDRRIKALVHRVSDDQARWKPDPESWSILEVINHLYDEERLDFRVRLDFFLHKPGQDPSPIDPPGWVTERHYNEQNLDESLQNFQAERRASLAWLESLVVPDWEIRYQAPWGVIRAGDMMAAWVAHDLLHMRQFVELHWAYTVTQIEPFQVHYAGEW